jgi:hypothetical protein
VIQACDELGERTTTGEVRCSGDWFRPTPPAVRVSPGVTRALQAGDAGLEILVFGPHVENDVEIVDDLWGTR